MRKVFGPRKDGQMPWDRKMTICIAALCSERPPGKPLGRERVVVCFDHLTETVTASAETGYKFDFLGDNWAGLYAGTTHEAQELISLYQGFLSSYDLTGPAWTTAEVLEELRKPPRDMKLRKAEACTRTRVAMSYKDFLDHGKDDLPEDLYRNIAWEIDGLRINADIILIGYLTFRFGIFLFKGDTGEVMVCQDFVAIGTGAIVAESALYQREQQSVSKLNDTLYCVYEAKRLAETTPGVGTITSLIVLNADPMGKILVEPVSQQDETFLAKQFKRFGPKPIKSFTFPKSSIVFPDEEPKV